MKNPWMSWWLSEWHKAANASKGQMMAEMSRQQSKILREWQEQSVNMWMSFWMPWAKPKGRSGR